MRDEEVIALLLFNRITNYTPKQKFDLIERYKNASAIFSAGKKAEDVFNKPFKINGRLLNIEKERANVQREFCYYRDNNIFIIDLNSSKYPARLKYIYDPPVVLFVKGQIDILNEECSVGVVGARKASNSSITIAYSVARDLSKAGSVVVSGLASGIDYYAHKGALDSGGMTAAVLGNGIDIIYPRDNREMYERIKREGALITEFPVGTTPFKRNFPMRNRIISGLSLGVAVVEASQTSGALITAMFALDHGREVMAFPGLAASESFGGNNRLIKEGAHLVEDASDILSVLGKDFDYKTKCSTLSYSPVEHDILRVIGEARVSIEEIENVLNAPISGIVSALMLLELKGAVVQHPGKIFSRVYRYGK